MSSNDVSDSVCVVCFKPIEIYSIGDCDHPVCFECSTRMRVLCLQTECPICRHDISKVVFTYKVELYKTVLGNLTNKKTQYDDKYKILFSDFTIKEAYCKLLEHYCKKCGVTFKLFSNLKEHMSKEHEVFFCDLCIDNLKIFTNERKFYTRQQLAVHRRKGDPDDTSHKGHPLCEFCDSRYMDNDELFRHLRKDHLYCHLCDADGFHQYYVSFHTLRDHFRKDHYLCEEGDCCSEGNMTVFRTDIDFKAHKASEHGRGLSKQAARQARTLEVQFTLTPRPLPARIHHRTDRPEGDNHSRPESNREPINEIFQVVESNPVVDMDSIKQFPNLGDSGPSSAPSLSLSRQDKPVIRQTSGALARTDENFPALSSDPLPIPSTSFRLNISHPVSSSTTIRTNGKPNVCIQVHNNNQSSTTHNNINKVNSAQGKSKALTLGNDEEKNKKFLEEFPSLNKKDKNFLLNNYTSYASVNNSTSKKQVVVKQLVPVAPKESASQAVSSKAPPPQNLEAFPALQPTSSNASASSAPAQPQWIAKVRTKEVTQKECKVKAEPLRPQSFVNDINQFPTPPPISGISWSTKKRHEPNKSSDASQSNKPQWVVSKQKSTTPKESRVAPAPVIPTQSLNIADFPSLKSKQKKKKFKEVERDLNDNSLNATSREKEVKNKVAIDNEWEKPRSAPKKSNNNSQQVIDSNILLESEFLKSKPPPDFSPRNSNKKINSNPTSPPCNGFTFTNSSGENFKIPAHDYIQPINFNERNKCLVSKFMDILGKTEAIHEFKLYSQLFREGSYSAEFYYKHCIESMKDGFNEMFPELLVLLPDIRKQQELYKVHLGSNGSSLRVCDICGQILVITDLQFHKDFHTMQSAFPALGPSSAGASKQK